MFSSRESCDVLPLVCYFAINPQILSDCATPKGCMGLLFPSETNEQVTRLYQLLTGTGWAYMWTVDMQ